MSKRVLCKFHVHRACLKGEHCEFSHDLKDEPNNICTYYQKGMCSYGSRCRYDHVKVTRPKAVASSSSAVPLVPPTRTTPNRNVILPAASAVLPASPRAPHYPRDPTWNLESLDEGLLDNGIVMEPRSLRPAADLPICSFAAAGNCPHGEKCPHLHGDLCSTCGKHCLHPFRPQERDEHIRACEQRKKHDEALKRSEEIECCVCLDRVLSKPTEAERKFGLLSECDHSFCISCIRNWRSSSPSSGIDPNTSFRACPICRKTSYFVIPSRVWYSNPEEKQEIVDNYKSKLSSINCKHFNFGNGSCPFGTSCFYKHTVKPGSYVWKNGRPPPRLPSRMRRARRSNDMGMHSVLDDIFETLLTRDLLDDYNDYDDYDDYDDYTVPEPSEDDIEAALFLMGYYDFSDEENDDF